ncbi:efflux RND transporter periplasmic adaptor subunit [Chitinophaga nivalis]|uniref:Efflux RND transporter periplasmic adaptor subunit n=1 Tax=Chitinophaga nivalis TaxID=2991709 RepID=A0ABT3ILM8_9BACT|nr:efflux RND transporter periplasmic adaptor subunit [Chitinophaga nivalis]MCW3465440.1 efflux RND transporter periplasmic adaptor subunit [Chitinophaga nivalis]MCW3484868.1 efflux RND transporter periplasmic adaptor subunit [Chitinophaga nivalis]
MKRPIIFLGFCLLAAIIWSGCKDTQAEEAEKSTFVLSDTMLKNIRIDTARMEPVLNELRLSGKVAPNGGKVLKVYPLVSGYVEDIKVQLGDYVQKGQVLAVIHSAEIADYEKQLAQARSDRNVADKNLKVAQDLYDSRLSTEKDVVNAKGEVQKSDAEINRLNDLFKIYRKGKGATYLVTAPISGYIIEKNINNSMEIRTDNSTNIFTISELDDVWVMANVFETDIARIKEGYEADVVTVSYPDQPFHGKIDKIYNFLDPATKTMQVRIRIDNKNMLLKPEMFATVYVTYQDNDEQIAVPSAAIIFDNSKNFVLVFKDKFNISVRQVEVAKTAGDITYISAGLKPEEKVISKNQLLIYDALKD